jgi:hypothetical protein
LSRLEKALGLGADAMVLPGDRMGGKE